MPFMIKRPYLMALACYLAIPLVTLAGAGLSLAIDPECAQHTAHYERNYRLLEWAATGMRLGTAGLIVALWIATCHQVLAARQRSRFWLALAAAGPFGFAVIALLADLAPVAEDSYQRTIPRLNWWWRVFFELGFFLAAWVLVYQGMAMWREGSIQVQSFLSGTPVATIVAIQEASSGMAAFVEGLGMLYPVPLVYLLWPLAFNFAAGFCLRGQGRTA